MKTTSQTEEAVREVVDFYFALLDIQRTR